MILCFTLFIALPQSYIVARLHSVYNEVYAETYAMYMLNIYTNIYTTYVLHMHATYTLARQSACVLNFHSLKQSLNIRKLGEFNLKTWSCQNLVVNLLAEKHD